MTKFKYVGSELELFAAVHNWKSYWSRQLRPFLRGDILEVGAGIGSNTPLLDPGGSRRFVCLEPDPGLITQLTSNLAHGNAQGRYEIVCGTLRSLDPGQKFDTIVYIDVLEHIEDDRGELESAAAQLKAGGRIVLLSPAHQWLFTPFDAAIGHFRRYDHSMLQCISPPGVRLEYSRYLDSMGLTLSLANRLFLRQSTPTREQLRFWDQRVIPVSRVLDRSLFFSVGKSIMAIWRRASDSVPQFSTNGGHVGQ